MVKQPLDDALIDDAFAQEIMGALEHARSRGTNPIVIFGTLQGCATVAADDAGATRADFQEVINLCWDMTTREVA